MNVSLTKELVKLVQAKVRTGLYGSASEVVREGLRLLQEREQVRQLRLGELRREITQGISQADRGQVARLDVRALKAEGRRRKGRR